LNIDSKIRISELTIGIVGIARERIVSFLLENTSDYAISVTDKLGREVEIVPFVGRLAMLGRQS